MFEETGSRVDQCMNLVSGPRTVYLSVHSLARGTAAAVRAQDFTALSIY